MDFGVSYFSTDESIEPAALARLAEERGFESVFVTEHTHIPASRETPYPAGGELPREYSRIYDPFVALTTMAAATERIRIGTAICLLVERDPITTAKAVASLDRLSGGRMVFGVGAGWNLEEMRDHGTDPAERFRILRERVEACKEIWAERGGDLPRRVRELRPPCAKVSGFPTWAGFASRCVMTSVSEVVLKMLPYASYSSRRSLALIKFPLWATAT